MAEGELVKPLSSSVVLASQKADASEGCQSCPCVLVQRPTLLFCVCCPRHCPGQYILPKWYYQLY